MGEVYLAEDLNLHRRVAIKILPPGLTGSEARLQRFYREAYTASSLNHPNLLTIYELSSQDDYHFIVSEFVDGESLRERKQRGPFTLGEVIDIGMQVASALNAAHGAGIMHRDIKPENIMIRNDGVVKVLDFGLAKLSEPPEVATDNVNPEVQLTNPGALMGTARYMSPEQARGDGGIDTRTDIWSLGVVLYELSVGVLPFDARTIGDVLVAVLTTEPIPLASHSASIPQELDQIVTKTLCKAKEARYQHAKDIVSDLQMLKRKLDFNAELMHSAETNRGSQPDYDPSAQTIAWVGTAPTTPPVDVKTRDDSGKPRTNRRLVIPAIAASILIVAIAAGYFAYTRYRGSNYSLNSIAVLPFVNTTKDPEQEYLSDGISESLINRLSKLPGVKVIASSSSIKYKGKDIDPVDVASALGVNSIVSGRIARQGDNLIISVELIDGRDRTHIWGEQYQRKATDIQAVQAEISSEVADKMRLKLTDTEQKQVAKPDAVNPEAYELLLRGRAHRSREGTEDRKKAAEYFQQAIQVDGTYALAYAELASVYRSLIGSNALDPKEYLPKANVAALTALKLDPNLADAHYTLANLKVDDWDWHTAQQEYERAIELNSNLALAHRYYSVYLSYMGRHDEALKEINVARDLDPLSARINSTYCQSLYFARQFDASIDQLKKTLQSEANQPYAYVLLANSYAAKGMHTEALDAYQQAAKLGFLTSSTRIYSATESARTGNSAAAKKALSDLQMSKEYVSSTDLAVLYDALGDREKAFAALESAYQSRDVQLQFLLVDPRFDSLRSDARFGELIKKLRFPTS